MAGGPKGGYQPRPSTPPQSTGLLPGTQAGEDPRLLFSTPNAPKIIHSLAATPASDTEYDLADQDFSRVEFGADLIAAMDDVTLPTMHTPGPDGALRGVPIGNQFFTPEHDDFDAEQLEMAADPDADMDISEEGEVDELDSSQAPTPNSHPDDIPRRPRIVPLQLEPLQFGSPGKALGALAGYASESDFEDDQVGGGGPRREATPPKVVPASRLRSRLTPTAHASAQSFGAVERRRQLDPTPSAPPIVTLPLATYSRAPPPPGRYGGREASAGAPAGKSPAGANTAAACESAAGRNAAASNLAGFKTMDIPPPPPGYKPPAPADDAPPPSFTAIDADNDGMVPFDDDDAPMSFNSDDDDDPPSLHHLPPSEETSDAEDDSEPEDGTSASPSTSGTPNAGRATTKQRKLLETAYGQFVQLVGNTAAETGLSEARVVKSFIKDIGTQDRRAENRWNAYLKYAHAPSNVVKERQRLNPAFTLNEGEEVPPWLMADLAVAFQGFKAEYGDTAGEVLDVYRSLAREQEEETMETRHRLFAATVRKIQRTFDTMEKLYDFHGLFLLVGTRVNEDSEFAEFRTTGVLDQLLARLKLKPNEFLGVAKVLAFNDKVSHVEAKVDNTAPSTSAPPKASRPRRTKASTKRDTAHLTQQQKGEVAKAAKQARHHEAQIRINNIREELSRISAEDIDVDLWRELPPRNGFSWKLVPQLLANNHLRLVGFPQSVRPPPHFLSLKGIGGLHLGEIDALEGAIAARGDSPVHGGLRVERYEYKPNGIVIFMHDYGRALPPGDPASDAVKQYWRTSGESRETVIDGLGQGWSAPYNIDRDPEVSSSQRRRLGLQVETKKKAKPATGKGKAKAKEELVSSDSDEDAESGANEDEYEEEELTLPAPRVTRAMAAAQEGGGPAPKKATASAKPATASANPAAPPKAAAPKAPSKPALKAPNASLAPAKKRVGNKPVRAYDDDDDDDAPPPPARRNKKPIRAYDDDDDDAPPPPARRNKKPVRAYAGDDDDAPPPPAKRKRPSPTVIPETEDEDDDDVPLGNRSKARSRATMYVAAPPQKFVQGSSRVAQGGSTRRPAPRPAPALQEFVQGSSRGAQGGSTRPPTPPPAPTSSAAPPPDVATALSAAFATLPPEALASVVNSLMTSLAPK
ncbi:hypothetical protein B0H11DRAFT_1908101 [Mycena galericulata]|nr:hypothetical protein B0H11DRAFT_1908101 [Mycena galericulata]